MAWNTYTTTTTQLDNSLVSAFSDLVYFAAQPELVVDQFADIRENLNGKDVTFSKYSDLTVVTSALTEADEDTAEQMSDTYLTVTPAEYGKSTIRTKLASLQSGGKADRAAAQAVGFNMGRSIDKIAMAALDAATPVATIYPNAATGVANLATTDNLDRKFMNRLYNKLARRNAPPAVAGLYAGITHDDALFDLRDDLQDIAKYGLPETVTRNAIGVAGGIVWYRSANATISANQNGTIDAYYVHVFGANVLAKAVSQEPGVVISGPFDRLGRFLNVGWYGVIGYGILDGNNLVIGKVASSVGAN